jgi:serine/threonine-protein kinase
MDAERWKRLSPLLDVLLELDPPARAHRLDSLRAQDPDLATELEQLLALEEEDSGFMQAPLLEKPALGLQPGTLIGPYRLEELLGEGGMGMVWLAIRADGLYQRRVALKLLRPGLADPNLRLRFTREREILARLEHPNIARLLDAGVGQEGGQPYLALEFVEGTPITDYCWANTLSVDETLALFLQVCEAVSHAHANLIVHRDLKPSNILVSANREVRLLDFGIAKLLDEAEPAPVHPRTEVRAFTLHYAAPEQIRGEPVTTMTDVYSLGVVIYELLAGTKPYRLRRQSDAEWEEAILAVDPLKPSVAAQRTTGGGRSDCPNARRNGRRLAGDLDNIVLKALAKAPEQRYPSVEALALDLRRHLEGRPVHARPQSLGYRARKYISRHRWSLTAGIATTVILIGALGASLWQSQQAVREAARAQAMQNFVIGLFDNAGSTQQGNAFDARELLAAGERRGERELARQPLAHAELLGVIARLRIGLGDYREALKLLERQDQLLGSVGSSPPEGLRLEGATQRGRVLALMGRPRDCIDAMLPLESQIGRLQLQLPQQSADFLSQDGRCRRAVADRQTARQMFQRSQLIRRGVRDQIGVAESLVDLAGLESDMGNADGAIRGLNAALVHLHQYGGERHPLTIDIERSMASLYRTRGDSQTALLHYQRALELANEIHGAQHPATLAVRRQMAAVQVDLGHFRQAAAQMKQLHGMTMAALGPYHRETGSSWNSMGIIAWELGDGETAITDLAHAVSIWRYPDNRQQLPGGLYNYGMVLHDAGRDDQALAALLEARRLRVELFGASHALVGDTDRLIGEVLAARGKQQEAETYFERAEVLTRIGYGAGHPRALFAQLSLARQLGRSGQVAPALAQLDALAVRTGEGSEIPKLRWTARAYAAELRCQNGQRERGRRELDNLVAELRRLQPDGGVIPREVDRLRAACI